MEYISYILTFFFNSPYWADFFSVVMLYSVFKFLLVGVITELVWPTQLFNRVHNYLNESIRFRSYNEYILKLSGYSTFYYIYYNIFLSTYVYSKNFYRI